MNPTKEQIIEKWVEIVNSKKYEHYGLNVHSDLFNDLLDISCQIAQDEKEKEILDDEIKWLHNEYENIGEGIEPMEETRFKLKTIWVHLNDRIEELRKIEKTKGLRGVQEPKVLDRKGDKT